MVTSACAHHLPRQWPPGITAPDPREGRAPKDEASVKLNVINKLLKLSLKMEKSGKCGIVTVSKTEIPEVAIVGIPKNGSRCGSWTLPDCKLGRVPTNQGDPLCSGASRTQGLSVILAREPLPLPTATQRPREGWGWVCRSALSARGQTFSRLPDSREVKILDGVSQGGVRCGGGGHLIPR